MHRIACFVFGIGLSFLVNSPLFGQLKRPEHPRGLISAEEVSLIRDKISREPFKDIFVTLKSSVQMPQKTQGNVYEVATQAKLEAFMYILTNESVWAEKSFAHFETLVRDSLFVNNPFSKGLTRSHVLRELSMAYDFCFDALSNQQKSKANNLLYDLMLSVNNSMGPMANYHLESNWMGVRYGSVVLAASVIDAEFLDNSTENKMTKPFVWDAQRRLSDHLKAAFTPDGWFMESLGYQVYDWEFACPAIIALQNSSRQNKAFFLENYAPQLLNSLDQHFTSIVNIARGEGYGLQADLADDNPNASLIQFVYGMRLMPDNIKPYCKWMIDYLYYPKSTHENFMILALVPEDIPSKNPEKGNYLNYVDKTQGVVFFRNQFKNKQDIVACFNASSNHVHGHAGPDNLTFRLIGLGNLWVVGAGRTGEVAGQTNLFPVGDWQKQKQKDVDAEFKDYKIAPDGSGYAVASGSCLGVENHQRKFIADYSSASGARAVFVVVDSSSNGKVWRLNTPEFNEVSVFDNGFYLIAPNGASLKATVAGVNKAKITQGMVRYGGSTTDHNAGIGFGFEYYQNNKTVDIECDGDITVVMTLQEKGEKHREIDWKNYLMSK